MGNLARLLAAATLILSACGASSDAAPQGAPASPRAAIEHVIVVSADGLMPAAYLEPGALAVPTLRAMVAGGAYADGAESVMPSVTYPAHTSIVTGVRPAAHGITTNKAFDPLLENQDGWRWYAEDIAVPTLWTAARARGLNVGIVNWPVSVGAEVDAVVPEYWRAGTPEDAKLIRALSTRGLLAEVERRHPDFYRRYQPPEVDDTAFTDIAEIVLEAEKPNLLLVHLWNVDDEQHSRGPGSAEAAAAIEKTDAQLARLIAAARRAGIWDRTALVLVSDHGFAPISRRVRPGVRLVEAGLVTLDPAGKPKSWKASVSANDGGALFYVNGDDPAAAAALRELLDAEAARAGSWVGSIIDRDGLRAMGADPAAAFAVDGAPGFGFTGGYTGAAVEALAPGKAAHGYAPSRPEMAASLVVYGPPVAAGELGRVRLIDVAPTIATWLGLDLGDPEGEPLPVKVRRGS